MVGVFNIIGKPSGKEFFKNNLAESLSVFSVFRLSIKFRKYLLHASAA
jgi:hypothetical protein